MHQAYHQSPTLSASQALLARSQAAPGAPGLSGGGLDVSHSPSFQGYHQPVQYQPAFQTSPPLPMQGGPVSHPGYRASLSGYPSSVPGEPMGAHGYISGGEEHLDYVVDPYRSAYSQQHSASVLPYQEDLNQPSYNPRYSVVSSGGASGQHYPMQMLHSRDSNQALLSAPFQPQASPAMHQLSQAESRMSQPLHQGGQETEEDENDRLQRIAHSKDDVNGNRRSNSGSQTKVFATLDDSEEEGQEKGESRWRERKRCFCCSRRVCVYLSFLFAICLGIALFFIVPRAPSFTYSSLRPLGPPVVTRDHIEEPFTLQVRVDNTDNYLPFRLNSMDMNVWMKIDFTKIGNNDDLPSNYIIKPRQVSVISIPMALNYTSLKVDTNADGTLQTLFTACKPVPPNSPDPIVGLNLVFGGKMFVWGLSWVWKPEFSFNVDSAPCPVNARDPVEIEPPPPQATPTSGPVNGTTTVGTRTGSATASATGTHLSTMTTASASGATTPP
ncbi:hypothetical protein KVV02_003241 [Mortierella alpina]|uniref:Uncharacterized protein n=1 Tax=Mortierella alpina TaxID=64518 RepID=A0A9P8A6Z9_MORAP|nr:hypothetical protein KVV02_003241 [Mortierella alpina]